MHISCIPAGPVRANCYILGLEGSGDRVVIDPGGQADKLKKALNGCRVEAILLTHGHFDHIGAVDELCDEHTKVYIHEADLPMLTDKDKNAASFMGMDVTVSHEAIGVKEGDTVTAAGLTFTCLHTPGHTPGGACWLRGEDLFTGDTLFQHSYGRTDLYGGDFSALMVSLMRLLNLSGDLVIHPGHEGDTTLKAEQEHFL
ncbi:MAG: MBL fold metallo-hydrolase [Clostridia bacterium]|nr:MBL fold metallo-hydrolase [Clostridia bacterium]